MTDTCYWVDELVPPTGDASKMSKDTGEDYVISNFLRNANNPVVGQTINKISFYLCKESGLTGGIFRFGIWSSSDGSLIRETDIFSADQVVTGTDYNDCEKFTRSITEDSGGSYTLQEDDCIGVVLRTKPTSTGTKELFIGMYDKGSEIDYWARYLFTEDDTFNPSNENEERALTMCVGTGSVPGTGLLLPPPIAVLR